MSRCEQRQFIWSDWCYRSVKPVDREGGSVGSDEPPRLYPMVRLKSSENYYTGYFRLHKSLLLVQKTSVIRLVACTVRDRE